MAVLFIVPSASAATRSTAKVTFVGSVVKGADGTVTASGTFRSKQRACLKSVPLSNPFMWVTFYYPGPPGYVNPDPQHPNQGSGGEFFLHQIGLGRWQRVVPPGSNDGVHFFAGPGAPTGTVVTPVSTATSATLQMQPKGGEKWQAKKGGRSITCKTRFSKYNHLQYSI